MISSLKINKQILCSQGFTLHFMSVCTINDDLIYRGIHHGGSTLVGHELRYNFDLCMQNKLHGSSTQPPLSLSISNLIHHDVLLPPMGLFDKQS